MASRVPTSTVRSRQDLTLHDRLSRLTYTQAVRLLGPEGEQLLYQGGAYDVELDQVTLGHDQLRLELPDAVVTVTLDPTKLQRLQTACSACAGIAPRRGGCVHLGAALSLVLEEKMLLGLAAPPPERVPMESLSEEELVERAIEERAERARCEKMTLRSTSPKELWTEYTLTSAASGKTYRLALRGWERGESYCSCPDYRKNTLGTCKHLLHAFGKVRKRFPAARRRRAYLWKHPTLHLRYGEDVELRLGLPKELPPQVLRLVRPFRDRAIVDVQDLVRRLSRLEAAGFDVTIYPDAEEHIERRLFRQRIEEIVARIRRDPENHPLRCELLEAELLPYQLDGIAFAVGAGRAVLADDMGLGKTIQGIGVAEMLAREAGISRVLVICPASLKAQWKSEIRRFSERDCQVVLGGAATRPEQYESGSFFTVCNYEQVLRDVVTVERVAWDLILLDEGQRIKNWEAKTSRVIKGLRSRFALILTGTPLENRLEELFSVVELIDDRRLGPAFRFLNRHRVVDERGRVLGYKNLGELREKLQPVLLRRTRASVRLELPERSTEVIHVAPTEEQVQLHLGQMRVVRSIVNKKFLSEMDLLRLRKALLLCRLAANSTFLVDKTEPGYSSKLEELDELLAQLAREDDRKILLFSEWTRMLDLVEPLLERRGIRWVRLDGSVPQKKRQALVDRFSRDADTRVFLTTNAGAVGLNLQAANTVVNVDLPWNPAVLEQRISRAHRMGQTESVQVFVLITEGTIEQDLLSTLSGKHALALAALDTESEVDTVDLRSGIEELKRRLEVLLGARPEAPVDESEKDRLQEEADRIARQQRVARAGGEVLSAAFSFLGELFPQGEDSEESRRMAALIQGRLSDCLEQDDEGKMQLTVTLPDPAALEGLASSLSRLLTASGPPEDVASAAGRR